MFYPVPVDATTTERHSVTYLEHHCRSALNRVKGMPFSWTLNPYTGCAHRCTFCYVRAFEARADRPSDDRYGRAIRVKSNVADVLRIELGRRSWKRERRSPASSPRNADARPTTSTHTCEATSSAASAPATARR